MAKYTTESYIEKARNVHSDKYAYDKTIYEKSTNEIIVTCAIHGDFAQVAAEHIRGKGCSRCSKCFRYDTNSFIEEANKIHFNKYDYSSVEYKNATTKLKILCKDHGEFVQISSLHLAGQGCIRCARVSNGLNKRLSQEKFISDCIQTHSNKYDYFKTEYKTSGEKITVICREHGEFCIKADAHRRGAGCLKCAAKATSIRLRKSTEEFIASAERVHGQKYTYALTDYIEGKTKVVITCSSHGNFSQTPSDHLNGNGCQSCAYSGYKVTHAGYFYILASDNITKIGITNKEVKIRARKISKSSGMPFEIKLYIKFENGQIPLDMETILLRELRQKYKQPTEVFDGSTECFYDVPEEDLILKITNICGNIFSKF